MMNEYINEYISVTDLIFIGISVTGIIFTGKADWQKNSWSEENSDDCESDRNVD